MRKSPNSRAQFNANVDFLYVNPLTSYNESAVRQKVNEIIDRITICTFWLSIK